MPITIDEIREQIKAPAKKPLIRRAINHESRLVFHTALSTQRIYGNTLLNQGVTYFFDFIDSILAKAKANLHKKFFTFPVETLPLIEEIKSDVENVFDGQDPIYKAVFASEELAADWSEYREEKNLKDFWRSEGLAAMFGKINSLIIVDTPREQTTFRPDPYAYFECIENVLDYQLSPDGCTMDWVMIKKEERPKGGDPIYKLFVLDDQSYRVFVVRDGSYSEILSEELNAPHDVGYCPASFFWKEPQEQTTPDLKKSPLSPYLSALDKLLKSILSKQVLDHINANPITWFFQGACSYQDPQNNKRCDGGFLRDASDNYIVSRDSKNLEHCPVCHESRFPGPGSFIGVDPPTEDNNVNLREPAGVIKTDVASLEYNTEQVEAQKRAIYSGVTGNSFESINSQAINEDQVQSFFESRKRAIFSIKRNLEFIHTWTDKTKCLLRYGSQFKGLTINYGTEFFLFSAEEALQAYQAARKEQLSPAILDQLFYQYIMTKYRHNPDQMERVRIINALDPFCHLSNTEVLAMRQNNLINYNDFYLKINLSSLINQFERDNGDILQFGVLLEYKEKIKRIKDTLLTYITEPAPLPEVEPQNQ